MKEVVSTVGGRVIACHVAVGDAVQEGTEIATVESMKMEIPVESEVEGKIIELLVSEGDEVEEGQRLAVVE